MKNIFSGLFLITLSVASFFAYPAFVSLTSHKKISYTIDSPLPQLLTKLFPTATDRRYVFSPNLNQVLGISVKKPNFTASSALMYDLSSNKLIISNSIKERRPIASLTKIATAIVALENEPLDKTMTVSKNAAEIGEDSMGLSEGEKYTLKDLLYGLLMQSGNDAAETIAQNSKFGRDNFVYLMNKKAEDLGLSDTHFTNPTGLEGDGNQYSTAYDLLLLTNYALQNRIFKEIVSTVSYDISYSFEHKAISLYSETNLLTTYPGVKGVKTGYTNEAGLCLVTYFERDGHNIIGIVLNAENRREEMKEMLDYTLKAQGVTPPPHT